MKRKIIKHKMNNKIKIYFALLTILVFLINIISALSISSVSVNPNEVAPGKTSDITISIRNDGDNNIKDVSINLDLSNLPFAPYNSGSDYSINQIDNGDTRDASFEMIALDNAASGIYKIPVKITYTDRDSNDNDVIKTKDSLISLTINSIPKIETSIDSGTFLKGQKNTVNIKVVNNGLSDVKFLEVELSSSNYYTILSQKNAYIGDVNSNDFQSAEFIIFLKDKIPDTIKIPVGVSYRDVLDKSYSEDLTLPLKSYSYNQAIQLGLVQSNNTLYIVIIIIIVLIAVFFIYRAIRKRRRNNQN